MLSKREGEGTEKSKAYFNFINSIKSQSTKGLYENNIKLFMKFCGVTSFEALLNIEQAQAQEHIINYVVSLREQKLVTNSIRSRLNPIFHFYEMNDVMLNKRRIKKFMGENIKKARDRAYTHEEIKKILDVSDLRLKVIILLMASTGCRAGPITALRKRNLEKIKIQGSNSIYKVTFYEDAPSDVYYGFTTPECASFIDAYLEYRTNNGENLTDDSYLIRDQFDITDVEQIRNKSKGIALNTLFSLVSHALLKAGLRSVDHKSKDNRKTVARCHGFRKFYTTVWTNSKSKLNPERRELLLGHKIGLASAYYRPTQDDFLEEYLKAVNELTINEENKLRMKVQTLEADKSQIEAMAQDLEELKKFKIDYDQTFSQRFKEMQDNVEYYEKLYGPPPKKNE